MYNYAAANANSETEFWATKESTNSSFWFAFILIGRLSPYLDKTDAVETVSSP